MLSASGLSLPEPSRDATGDENATVTMPVAGGTWFKGGLSVAVTGPLGRMRVSAVGKKPYVESEAVRGECGSPGGRATLTRKGKLVACGLAWHMMGGYKGATNEI